MKQSCAFSWIVAVNYTVSAILTFPSLKTMVDGVETTLYVHYPYWSTAKVDESSVEYGFKKRMYLSTVQYPGDTDKYFKPNLLGGAMEYDIDLS